ncbi:MAG: hypothetical protein AB7U73_15440 [Pirellulales bacterium]
MSVRYRLPCGCGQEVLVERSQAGLPVSCSCGATLEVPTIRGLADLETVHTESQRNEWTTQYGLLLLGLLVAFAAGGAAFWRIATQPPDVFSEEQIDLFMTQKAAEIDKMTPSEALEAWQHFRAGPYVEDTREEQRYYAQRAAYARWNWVLAGISVAGLLFCILVLATGAGKPTSATVRRRASVRQ